MDQTVVNGRCVESVRAKKTDRRKLSGPSHETIYSDNRLPPNPDGEATNAVGRYPDGQGDDR
jgi:hypothetical protein